MHLGIVYTHLAHGVRCLDQIELNNEAEYRRILCAFRVNCMLIAESIGWLNSIFGWSNAATILIAFQLILSTLNWTILFISYALFSDAICK